MKAKQAKDSVRTWGADKLNLTLKLRQALDLTTLDFSVPDWGVLGEPIPDSQVRWGRYDAGEVADIIAPDYTLEDYYWLVDDPITEHYLRTLRVAVKAKRDDKYGTGGK
jgi:hypothetical protein